METMDYWEKGEPPRSSQKTPLSVGNPHPPKRGQNLPHPLLDPPPKKKPTHQHVTEPPTSTSQQPPPSQQLPCEVSSSLSCHGQAKVVSQLGERFCFCGVRGSGVAGTLVLSQGDSGSEANVRKKEKKEKREKKEKKAKKKKKKQKAETDDSDDSDAQRLRVKEEPYDSEALSPLSPLSPRHVFASLCQGCSSKQGPIFRRDWEEGLALLAFSDNLGVTVQNTGHGIRG